MANATRAVVNSENMNEMALIKKDALRSPAFQQVTRQQEKYIMARLQGATIKQSREAAGYSPKGPPLENIHEHIHEAMTLFRETEHQSVAITREVITRMMLEDRAMAVNSAESLACAVQLGKLHGLYESDKQKGDKTNITITQNKLEVLSDSELLKHAGLDTLEPVEIDAVINEGE